MKVAPTSDQREVPAGEFLEIVGRRMSQLFAKKSRMLTHAAQAGQVVGGDGCRRKP